MNLYPTSIAIIGGGRWARVLTQVLCNLIPRNTSVSIHTFHNYDVMSSWILEQKFVQQVKVSQDWPNFNSEKIEAMIVVNAARDHGAAIEKGLNRGVPVLVEKPITLSYASSKRLIELAHKNKTLFAAAHVFLFATYLHNFSQLFPDINKIQSIHIDWMDPKTETRYGEHKQYDAGVPVFVDCLPHILSIIHMLTPNVRQTLNRLIFHKGGADLKLEIMSGHIGCDIKLERNGKERRRIVRVNTDRQFQIDFSKEPGKITDGKTIINGDPKWNIDPRPVTKMLSTFLKWSAGGESDDRLNVNIGLKINAMIDEISHPYNTSLSSWLENRFAHNLVLDDHLEYALKEILLANGPLPIEKIGMQIDQVLKIFDGIEADFWYKEFTHSDKKFDLIRNIAEGNIISNH